MIIFWILFKLWNHLKIFNIAILGLFHIGCLENIPCHPYKKIYWKKCSKVVFFFFFNWKLIKIIFHADSAHFIQKFEESNATPAGGYSAKWLPTVTTEMEDGRGACVCRKINVMVSNPKGTLSHQISDIRSQTHNAYLECKIETIRQGQKWNKAICELPAEI